MTRRDLLSLLFSLGAISHIPRLYAHSVFNVSPLNGIDFVLRNSPTSRKYLIETMPGGVALLDYNNDGLLDIFLVNAGRVPNPLLSPAHFDRRNPSYWNRLYRQNKDGTFTDVTAHAGLQNAGETNYGMGVAVGDYDNDGFPDIYVTNFGRNILYHNNGDGTFTDVTEKAGILKPGPRYSITAVSYDFDNDGWPDIYVAVDSQPSILFHNNHDGTFTDIAVIAGCAYSENGHEQAGMGVAVGDYDCDGWFDIFKTNFADDTCNLYHNNGDGTFTDATFSSGIGINNRYVAWGCGFIDCDNDGWPDLMQINGHVYPEIEGHEIGQTFKNPRLLYKNLGNGRFKDISSEAGPGINERFSSRGAAFGDYDNDGDIDVLILNMNDLPSLLRNDGGNLQNWIKIKLIGTKCNRTAIGARVRVVTGNHAQMDEVHSGSSVMSQCDLRLHFGLGKAQTVDVIEVKWPTTQKIERFTQVKANQILTIREGGEMVEPAKPKAK
jgi:enediyne biosynthesis protein E4